MSFLLDLPRPRLCDLVSLSVIPSVCEQDYCKSNQPLSLKLGCYEWAYQSGEVINFWWWSGPGFQIAFPLPHHCRIEDFRRFTGISHSRQLIFTTLSEIYELVRLWIHILEGIWQTSGCESGLIRKSGFKSGITCGWGYMPWRMLALSEFLKCAVMCSCYCNYARSSCGYVWRLHYQPASHWVTSVGQFLITDCGINWFAFVFSANH